MKKIEKVNIIITFTSPMPKYFILLLLLFKAPCFGQKNIPVGQGIIQIDFEKLPSLEFFEDTTSSLPSKKVSVMKDKNQEFIIKNASQVNTWFKPESLWLDYSIFIIRVDTMMGKWMRVYVNNENGQTMWTKIGVTKKFVKWSTFLLKGTSAVDKHPDFNLEIKVSPSSGAKTIKKMETSDCFEVLEVRGDWMKIRTNTTLDCNESTKTISSGWIQWCQNNRLTIQYSLTC